MPSLTSWKELSSFSTGWGTQIELSSLAELRRQSSELGEAKQLEVTEQSTEEADLHKNQEIQRSVEEVSGNSG